MKNLILYDPGCTVDYGAVNGLVVATVPETTPHVAPW